MDSGAFCVALACPSDGVDVSFSEHVHWILHGLLAISVWNLNN